MKWIVFSKKVFISLIAALILALPVFSPSANSGGTFSFNPQGPISPQGELAIDHARPTAAVDSSGNTYAVWEDYRGSGNPDIYFAYKPKDGAWQGNVKVNDDTGIAVHVFPAIAVDNNGNAYAVWSDRRNGDYHNPADDIYFAYRPKDGNWQTNTKVNQNTSLTMYPSIAVDANGNAYAVWINWNNKPDIYFSYRPAGGSWQVEEKVNQDSGNANPSNPRITSDPSGHVMVVWEDHRNGKTDIYSANKSIGGSWVERIVNNDGGGNFNHFSPDVAFINNPYPTFIAVWADFRDGSSIYYAFDFLDNWGLFQGKVIDQSNLMLTRVATDNAGNASVLWEANWNIYNSYRTPGFSGAWQTKTQVNDNNNLDAYHGSPCMAVNPIDGNASALWMDNRSINNNIYSSFRPAGGNWGENRKVNDDVSGQRVQFSPIVALDPTGNAFAFWVEKGLNQGDIYFSLRPRGGVWQPAVRVNDALGKADSYNKPFAAAIDSAGNAYAVWQDYRNGKLDLYFSFRPPGGSWQANERVGSNLTDPYNPALVVDPAGKVYAAWSENLGGKMDVYFAVRPAGGPWQAPEKVNDVSTVGVKCQYPSLAVGTSGTVYALWQDNRSGNDDIYFSSRSPGGNWQTNKKVSDDQGVAAQIHPKIAVDGQENAYALWDDYRNKYEDLYFSYRPAGGSWQGNTLVNQFAGGSQTTPTLAVNSNGEAYAAWADDRDGNFFDIYVSYRPVGGDWLKETKVNSDQGPYQRWNPSIAANSQGTILVAWERTKGQAVAAFLCPGQ